MKNIQHSTFNAQYPTGAPIGSTWTLNVGGRPSFGCWLLNVPKFLLISAIRVYQLTVSPLQTYLFGPTGGCRYAPSCSAYAMEALREHGVAVGTFLAAKRICRCHPWGGCGHDPVPPKMTNDECGASQCLANLPRSEEMTVAVGFSPRNEASTPARRGATVEDSASRVFQSLLRDENQAGSRFPWDKSHGYRQKSLCDLQQIWMRPPRAEIRRPNLGLGNIACATHGSLKIRPN